MKKYSTEDFKKKYNILFERLVNKEGFVDEIKEQRKSLGIPENGFRDTPEFAEFLFKKLKKDEKRSLTFLAFLESYATKNKLPRAIRPG
jgi:ribosomal protein RSM22 (predicted rRNA methylase)